jgi:hypothetical protein
LSLSASSSRKATAAGEKFSGIDGFTVPSYTYRPGRPLLHLVLSTHPPERPAPQRHPHLPLYSWMIDRPAESASITNRSERFPEVVKECQPESQSTRSLPFFKLTSR